MKEILFNGGEKMKNLLTKIVFTKNMKDEKLIQKFKEYIESEGEITELVVRQLPTENGNNAVRISMKLIDVKDHKRLQHAITNFWKGVN